VLCSFNAAIVEAEVCPANFELQDQVSEQQHCAKVRNRKCNQTSNECYNEWIRCVKEVDKMNEQVSEYNSFIIKCKAAFEKKGDQTREFTPPRSGAPANERNATQSEKSPSSDLSSRLKRQQERYKGSEAVIQQQREQALQRDRQVRWEREEKARKDHDAELAAQQARGRQLEKERAERLSEARKWHCYGEHESPSAGFERCKSHCSAFYDTGVCRQECYASSAGSVSRGRSCFKEP